MGFNQRNVRGIALGDDLAEEGQGMCLIPPFVVSIRDRATGVAVRPNYGAPAPVRPWMKWSRTRL